MRTTDSDDDHTLVAAAQAGDRDALDTLLRRHYDRIHAICRRIAGSSRDADDAAQEAMISIVRGLARFDGRAAFSTWTYRIATNASLDELRKRDRRPSPHSATTRGPPATSPTQSRLAASMPSSTAWPSTRRSTSCPRNSASPWCSATCATSTTPRSPKPSASPRHREVPHCPRSWAARPAPRELRPHRRAS